MERNLIYLDSETCGLHGPIVLFQYAEGNTGEIKLHEPWYSTINETIELFEKVANHPGGVCAFNLAFDWFHVQQMWSVLKLLQANGWGEDLLLERKEEYAEYEPTGRDGFCLKPVSCLDLMLVARKTKYQNTMNRGDIRIRRVPSVLAWQLAKELDSRITFPSILFARKKKLKNMPKWHVYDVKNAQGENVPEFKDVVLKFHPSIALKALAADALGLQDDAILLFRDIAVPPKYNPEELGYAPFAKAVGRRGKWNGAWPDFINYHIAHWRTDALAREYAKKDVLYIQLLDKHFDFPIIGDDDSELAACVACVRWRGYKIDIEGIKGLKKKANLKKWMSNPANPLERIKVPTAPRQVRAFIEPLLSPTEKAAQDVKMSTKKVTLEIIRDLTQDCECRKPAQATVVSAKMSYEEMLALIEQSEVQPADPNCPKCKGKGKVPHPAGKRAGMVLDARQADKEKELYDKLLKAGRFHASFKVIGALSSRMSGTDDLNPQAIKNDQAVRSQFPLSLGDMVLCGGDFSGFEVSLAEACYKDPELRKDLLTCEKCNGEMVCKDGDFFCTKCGCKDGKAIHALFGVFVFPDMDYDAIKATKKHGAGGIYDRCKKAVFVLFYGGEIYTLMTRLAVPEDVATEAFAKFLNRYPGVKKAQQRIEDAFKSMRQPGGLGKQVVWHEPAEKVESMLGFPRYFTLENMVCRELYKLANDPPKDWRDLKIKVLRRADREQFASGAVQSALFGAAFQIQSGNVRAAKNHEIQSTGAQITKRLQRRIWDVQPAGPAAWLVQPCNIHDEVLVPCTTGVMDRVGSVVRETVEGFRPKVPLIKMEWKSNLKSWAEKG